MSRFQTERGTWSRLPGGDRRRLLRRVRDADRSRRRRHRRRAGPLGIDGPAARHRDNPGAAGTRILLFTDGLVERRGHPIADSMDDVVRFVAEAHARARTAATSGQLALRDLADQLMVAAGDAQDDVALVIAEAREDDAPARHRA
ncbi:hypothetical protein FAIPA1_170083 [Frankia sp. AiPs1]|uniref:SpoIIE family protein phosphatase n=1 Tax=Frankia sp. AiPa1 TaxID=573492 RepID=UPI00202B75DA|nr:SpoIIE family protein phosphatase [Frankia sp. AiPa1]MCL9760313.1 serine/threonine-protein phosphatase [Frankia sp. AiPa1]